jgi:hypothetical protein
LHSYRHERGRLFTGVFNKDRYVLGFLLVPVWRVSLGKHMYANRRVVQLLVPAE